MRRILPAALVASLDQPPATIPRRALWTIDNASTVPSLAGMRETAERLQDLIRHISPCDLLLIEGFKHEPIPKLEVYRGVVGESLLHPLAHAPGDTARLSKRDDRRTRSRESGAAGSGASRRRQQRGKPGEQARAGGLVEAVVHGLPEQVDAALAQDLRTPDLGGENTTDEMTDAVLAAL